ncbi:MAG TPA: hypothetical protein VFI69_11810 [Candidatus Limnocylindrales bacterium]|nr:hypothetical protein [Candidatus Limnocylindrales bacterium]
MTPLLLIILGLAALAVGAVVLRSLGPNQRIGRLLAATPAVPIAEARALAAGPARYVAVHGRIDAEDEFEDDARRPLVLRRMRLQLGDGRRWSTTDEQLEAVDFELREGLDSIAVDHAALDAGLVVVPRESVGTAADAPDRVPPGTSPTTPMRLRVEQVSSIDHAVVVGVPRLDAAGAARMTAGLGRPLILSTLETPEAMRILAASGRRRPMVAAIAFAIGALAIGLGLVWALLGAVTTTALAASPAPSAAAGDPRSSGQGPGLVGDPWFAIGAMLAIGLAAALLTVVWVRATGGRRG